MSNIYELPRQDQRYDEASEWIAKLDRGLSSVEQETLGHWIAADQENQAVLYQMAELWDNMTVLSRLSDLFPEPVARPARSPHFAWSMAAVIVVSVLVGFWALVELNPNNVTEMQQVAVAPVSSNVYETAVGERSKVNLPDGTQVVLNTNSRLNVTYADNYRLLNLERGEIHVQVADDKTRPLSVIANNQVVQAVGTAFSLEITSDQQIELVVTEGKVLVGVHQGSRGPTDDPSPPVLTDSSVTVAAGEELILGSTDEEISEVSPEEIEVKLSWRQGNLVFQGESLEEAMKEIGRYTTVEFVILDDELKRVRIAGMFRAGDVDGLLETLHDNFNVSYQRTADGKILLN